MSASEIYGSARKELDSPAEHAIEVTPNDSADLAVECRALYIGADGNVQVDMVGGETVTFIGLKGGTVYPIRVARVYSTDTTATDIIALY